MSFLSLCLVADPFTTSCSFFFFILTPRTVSLFPFLFSLSFCLCPDANDELHLHQSKANKKGHLVLLHYFNYYCFYCCCFFPRFLIYTHIKLSLPQLSGNLTNNLASRFAFLSSSSGPLNKKRNGHF